MYSYKSFAVPQAIFVGAAWSREGFEEGILNTKMLYHYRLSSSQKKPQTYRDRKNIFAEVHFVFDFLD